MNILETLDFSANYSEMFSSNKNWIPQPLKENQFRSVTDFYGNKKYLIVDTRESLLYSNIDLIKRRLWGTAIPLCLGAITFIITSLVYQSPLVKIVSLISSIATPFFFSFVRCLFFQKIVTCSIGIQMNQKKEELLSLFGQKMIQALGGFEKVSKLKNDWDGSSKSMQTGIEYSLDQKKNVIIGFSFLHYNENNNQFEKKMAAIKKDEEGWKILESNGFIRNIKLNGSLGNNIIEYNSPEEKEFLERIARFINHQSLSSYDRVCITKKEILPPKGKTAIYMLDCPYENHEQVRQTINYLNKAEFN